MIFRLLAWLVTLRNKPAKLIARSTFANKCNYSVVWSRRMDHENDSLPLCQSSAAACYRWKRALFIAWCQKSMNNKLSPLCARHSIVVPQRENAHAISHDARTHACTEISWMSFLLNIANQIATLYKSTARYLSFDCSHPETYKYNSLNHVYQSSLGNRLPQ